jgi:hypothetical protein
MEMVVYSMLGISVLAACTLVCTAVALFVLHQPSLRVVKTWQSPAGLRYKDYEAHFLAVVETDSDFRGFPLRIESNFIVYVGREAGKPTYGHMVKHSFNATKSDEWDDVDLVIRAGCALYLVLAAAAHHVVVKNSGRSKDLGSLTSRMPKKKLDELVGKIVEIQELDAATMYRIDRFGAELLGS